MQEDDKRWAFSIGSFFILCFCLLFLICSTLNAHVIKYPSEGSAEVCYSELVSDSLTVGASAEEAPPEVELPQNSIRSFMEIIVYFVILVAVPIEFFYNFCKYFHRLFIE